jgi:hypothetical protein
LPAPGALTAAFRRFALRTTLIAGVMGATGPTGAEAESNAPAVTQPAQESGTAPSGQPPLSVREKKRRARIREALLESARGDLDGLEAGSETGYTRDLQGLSSRLTGELKAAHSTVHNRVAFVDPQKLDVALSLGFAPDYAVGRLLAEQKIHIPDNQLAQAGQKATSYYKSKFGVKTYTQDPTALTNLSNPDPQACVVVPSSERSPDIDIKGLSRADTVEFTNRHESWHCLDGKYNLRHLDPKKVEAVRKGTLGSQINDRTALEIYATVYRKEALADTGALGDMIRAGKGLDIIDKVADWRAEDPKDLQHLSSPVLKGLKAKIGEIGLDNFRKMSDADAQKLYFEVTDKWGMTGKSLQTGLRFETAKGSERQGYLDRFGKDQDVTRALLLETYVAKARPNSPAASLIAADTALAGQLKSWDADRLLDDKAFEIGKKITPQTIITAYNQLQGDLHDKMTTDPDNKLYPLQATKLQQAFLTHARELDYVGANAARGVDIVKTEAALKSFAEPAKKNAAAGAPASG